jgi:hypothetical protein
MPSSVWKKGEYPRMWSFESGGGGLGWRPICMGCVDAHLNGVPDESVSACQF